MEKDSAICDFHFPKEKISHGAIVYLLVHYSILVSVGIGKCSIIISIFGEEGIDRVSYVYDGTTILKCACKSYWHLQNTQGGNKV